MNAAPQPSGPLLSVKNLNAWYGAAHILHDVKLEVGRGEVVALMGRNGAGKSTTLKAIMSLVARRSGQIQFMGRDVARCQPYQIARLGLGYVPEDRRVFTELSVGENLMAGRQAARKWPDGQPVFEWTVQALYRLFPNLASMGNRPAGLMSGGEQQMLTVARSLMGNPYVLMLDEPSEGVAPLIVEQMVAMIQALKEQGTSILLSEQNIHFAQLVSDRAYVLEKGIIRYDATMKELADNTEVRQSYLGL